MKRIAASVAMALGLMGGAQAATVTYDFTVTNPFGSSPATVAGVFSYDDTASSTTRPSGGASAPTWYQASGMSLGGSSATNPYLGIANDITDFGTAVDLAYLWGTFSGFRYQLVLVLSSATFPSTAANQMNGLSFSDLTSVTSYPFGTFSSLSQAGTAFPLTDPLKSLTTTSTRVSQPSGDVPVPATLALLGLGLAGIGASRRKSV